MTKNLSNKLNEIQNRLSATFGASVEVTVRGLRNFTISFNGQNESLMESIKSFFGIAAKVTADYDAECDQTCVWVDC